MGQNANLGCRRQNGAASVCLLLSSLALMSACSPVEGQEQTLLGPGTSGNVCYVVARDFPVADTDGRQLQPPDYEVDGFSTDFPVMQDTDPKTVEVYDPEGDVTFPAVVVRCAPVTDDHGEFLSGDEPDYQEQLQLLTGF